MIDIEGVCHGMGWNHHGQQNGLTCVSKRAIGVYYRGNVLAPYDIPFARGHDPGFVFQDDNTSTHRAKVVTEYLQRRNIRIMPWPAKSTDLSPIKHAWDISGKRVRRRTPGRARCGTARGLGLSGHHMLTYWKRTSSLNCLL